MKKKLKVFPEQTAQERDSLGFTPQGYASEALMRGHDSRDYHVMRNILKMRMRGIDMIACVTPSRRGIFS